MIEKCTLNLPHIFNRIHKFVEIPHHFVDMYLNCFIFSGSNESAPRSERGELPIREFGEDDEISLYLDGESGEAGSKAVANGSRGQLGAPSGGDDGKDGIAEPLYTLMGEVFDMRGVFKWLRKTLISFVQITYGRTINR